MYILHMRVAFPRVRSSDGRGREVVSNCHISSDESDSDEREQTLSR